MNAGGLCVSDFGEIFTKSGIGGIFYTEMVAKLILL